MIMLVTAVFNILYDEFLVFLIELKRQCLCVMLCSIFISVISATISEDYGEWGNWGDWSQCSVSCGYGSIHRNKNWIYKNGQVSNYTYSMIVECWTKIACPSMLYYITLSA